MMTVMTLRLNSFIKIAISVILGNIDAIVSHQVTKVVPIWVIDLYAIPIEFVFVSGIYSGLVKMYKRVRNARKDLQ